MRIPEKSVNEPYFVARRLRRLTPNTLRNPVALSYISQAADLISAQAKKINLLTLKVANYERERPTGLPRTAPHGRILRGKTAEFIAQKIVDALEGPSDLWRARCGGYRLVRRGAFGAGEFIGTFDEKSTFHDVYTAIVGAPVAANMPKPPKPRKPQGGYTVKAGPEQAEKVAELIDGTVDLYRLRAGAVRLVKADQTVKNGEFLGRFDEGATWQDIKEAIE